MLTIFHPSSDLLSLYDIGYLLLPVSRVCLTSTLLISIFKLLLGNSVYINESPHCASVSAYVSNKESLKIFTNSALSSLEAIK